MALRFTPLPFVKPMEYNLGGGLDDIFEAYQKGKQDRLAERDRQGSALLQNGGIDPREVTPEVYRQAEGEQAQGEHPLAQHVRSFIEQKKSKAAMASQEQQLWMDKTRKGLEESDADIRLKNKQADALGQDQIYIDPTNGNKIKIPRGAKLLPPSAKQEGKILPANSVLALNEGKAVARILPEVEQAIKENESMFGPVEGRARSANPYDGKSQTVDARMRTASQAFGRFMEGGVLRKEDEDKYRKMFPQLSDIPDVAKNKLAIVRRQLAQKYQDDKGALGGSGYDVAGFGDLEIPASLFGESAPGGNSSSGGIALTGAKAARLAELRAKAGR